MGCSYKIFSMIQRIPSTTEVITSLKNTYSLEVQTEQTEGKNDQSVFVLKIKPECKCQVTYRNLLESECAFSKERDFYDHYVSADSLDLLGQSKFLIIIEAWNNKILSKLYSPSERKNEVWFTSQVADTFTRITNGIIYDSGEDRLYNLDNWGHKRLKSFFVTDHILIHNVCDYYPQFAWIHSHGLNKFNCPELEWYCYPPETWRDGANILNNIALYLVENGPIINIGDMIKIEGMKITLRFLKSSIQTNNHFNGNSVLRIQPIKIGDEGVVAFRQLIGYEKNPSEEHNKQGVELQLAGHLEEANQEYVLALEHEPDNFYALNNLGDLLLIQGKTEEALSLFQRAIEIEPNYALAYNNLGNAYLNLGKVDEAMAAYQQALDCDPNYAMPHRNLALIYHLNGACDQAIQEYQIYLAKATDDADAHYNLGVLLSEEGRTEDALCEYRQVLKLDAKHTKAMNNIGLIHLNKGCLFEADKKFCEALDVDKNFHLARYNLALTLTAQGDYPAAIQQLEIVVSHQPDWLEAASNLGVLYVTMQRFRDAINILGGLVRQKPENPTFHFNLGMAFQGIGQKEKAKEEYAKVISLEPADSCRAQKASEEMIKCETITEQVD